MSNSNPKRLVDLVVISDTHLGTIGCRAKELNLYLKSIDPKTIVLNGDIIDIWQFNKRHWDKYHTKVIKTSFKICFQWYKGSLHRWKSRRGTEAFFKF